MERQTRREGWARPEFKTLPNSRAPSQEARKKERVKPLQNSLLSLFVALPGELEGGHPGLDKGGRKKVQKNRLDKEEERWPWRDSKGGSWRRRCCAGRAPKNQWSVPVGFATETREKTSPLRFSAGKHQHVQRQVPFLAEFAIEGGPT